MKEVQYLKKIDKQHLMSLKDIFAYYDVTSLRGEGNLRKIYGRKDKRDLVISIFNVYIAEMFDEFVKGGIVFNFPDKKGSTMIFEPVTSEIVNKAKKKGKLKFLDPLASGFTSIKTTVKIPTTLKLSSVKVILSENYQRTIYDNLNNKVNLIGKRAKYWNDFTLPIYTIFPHIEKKSIDKVILFGLRKMIFFLTQGQEIFLKNSKVNEFMYFGKNCEKIKDISVRQKLLKKKYIYKLKWHINAKNTVDNYSYYQLTEENYQKHLRNETIPNVIFYKILEECSIGEPWYKYVFKTSRKSYSSKCMLKDYNSIGDELILTKPEYEKKHD